MKKNIMVTWDFVIKRKDGKTIVRGSTEAETLQQAIAAVDGHYEEYYLYSAEIIARGSVDQLIYHFIVGGSGGWRIADVVMPLTRETSGHDN